MPNWSDLRDQAAREHERLRASMATCRGSNMVADTILPAEYLLDALKKSSGIREYPRPPTDTILAGAWAVLDREGKAIYYADGPGIIKSRQLFSRAHEYAHFRLHPDLSQDSYDADTEDPAALIQPNLSLLEPQTLQSYSPRMRMEIEANIYAAELLLPSPRLRKAYLEEGHNLHSLVKLTGLSEACVAVQLAHALLLPPSSNIRIASATPQLNSSQEAAAYSEEKAVFVEAGPGTGKTCTLIARILWLLDKKVKPEKILALTFSNRAAEEIRMRLNRTNSAAAEQVWIGTFHALGYEILCREEYSANNDAPRLIDTIQALQLLARHIHELPLQEFLYPTEPLRWLPDVLRCIGRAKDELCDPSMYRQIAQQDLSNAMNEQEKKRAQEGLITADIFAFYQELLQKENLLDFGDLLMRAVKLLQDNSNVSRRWQHAFSHILVDEYQDVNRASAVFLKLLCAKCDSLWIVGDTHQAIYGFRGASSENIHAISQDFPGIYRIALEQNYRSHPHIVQLFTHFAAQNSTTTPPWKATRTSGSAQAVGYLCPQNFSEEVNQIAAQIQDLENKGIPLGEQAVLCRTNAKAGLYAKALTQLGLRVQHFGDPLNQPAAMGVLALLDVLAGHTAALYGAARLPRYRVPKEDVFKLIEAANQKKVSFPKALSLVSQLPSLSHQGRQGLEALQTDIADCAQKNANLWQFLVRYFFGDNNWSRDIHTDNTLEGNLARLALYQLLQLAQGWQQFGKTLEEQADTYLTYIRHLILTGAIYSLRLPLEIGHTDAVPVMTVHQAKGLEFRAVYLPQLVDGTFPCREKSTYLSLPPKLAPPGWMKEEEKRLFFVALSRAKDALFLFAPKQIGKKKTAKVSPFLTLLLPCLKSLPLLPPATSTLPQVGSSSKSAPINCGSNAANQGSLANLLPSSAFTPTGLENYYRCPQSFFYRYCGQLNEHLDQPLLVRFYHCMDATLQQLILQKNQGTHPTESTAKDYFLQQCKGQGLFDSQDPSPNPHAILLTNYAVKTLLPNAVAFVATSNNLQPGDKLFVNVGNATFRVSYQAMETLGNTVRLILFILRPLAKRETSKLRSTIPLLLEAAHQKWPNSEAEVCLVSLHDRNTTSVSRDNNQSKHRLQDVQQIVQKMRRGLFPPQPQPWECARCDFLWICSREQHVDKNDGEGDAPLEE